MVAHPRPFRFGVNPHDAHDAKAWRSMARKAEDLGFSTFLVPDHLNPQFAPFTALAVAAEATSTLRIGTQVLCNELRHPVVAAKEIATLDVLSDGRVEWGMGAGWLPNDFAAIGTEELPSVRVDRLVESIDVMRALFAGDAVHHDGHHYRVDVDRAAPVPLQRPHPPLIVGAAQQRLLTYAGRVAQIVSISPGFAARAFGPYPASITVEENTTRQVGWIEAGAGARFADVELSVVAAPARITDRPEEVAEHAAPGLGITPEEVLRSVHVLAGSVEGVCETLVARRERWGISNIVIPWRFVDQFGPVVARLAGT
ncbi:MAG: TIGR03621 family F420-dependent LLM class oxidoreductase [Acidimicrobiales bacterium]|nr:TIGR03621 family F420-dependent LLM class oxidoreductase [Acidimicrobiales bacterium]